MNKNFEKFIKEKSMPTDKCFYYKDYSEEVQKSIKNIYESCWRFGLYPSQIIFILNNALEPFKAHKSLYEMLGV